MSGAARSLDRSHRRRTVSRGAERFRAAAGPRVAKIFKRDPDRLLEALAPIAALKTPRGRFARLLVWLNDTVDLAAWVLLNWVVKIALGPGPF